MDGLKEIRLHGRGGLGTVKAAETLVYAAVMDGIYGNSIPFFGFERQGAPVTSFVRISDKPIRPKNRVYNPHAIVVLEPTIMNAVNVFEGVEEGSTLVLNTALKPDKIDIDPKIKTLAIIDANKIALELLGRPITNTVMLGAFVKATGWVSLKNVAEKVEELWGAKNREAVMKGFEEAVIYHLK
ncbi:MAG: 2-oxoacid:acceptor oxidoreductase family protein [Firmicutes bacterium]|nr:2-oxoacid:acceptor oxidoreductase family protein [Bacillota bacterium]